MNGQLCSSRNVDEDLSGHARPHHGFVDLEERGANAFRRADGG